MRSHCKVHLRSLCVGPRLVTTPRSLRPGCYAGWAWRMTGWCPGLRPPDHWPPSVAPPPRSPPPLRGLGSSFCHGSPGHRPVLPAEPEIWRQLKVGHWKFSLIHKKHAGVLNRIVTILIKWFLKVLLIYILEKYFNTETVFKRTDTLATTMLWSLKLQLRTQPNKVNSQNERKELLLFFKTN